MEIPQNKSSQETSVMTFGNLPVAYVRPVMTPEGINFAVCTGDGTQLALFATQDAAFFAAKQHELEPMLLH